MKLPRVTLSAAPRALTRALFVLQFAILFVALHEGAFGWRDGAAIVTSIALGAALVNLATTRTARGMIAALVTTALLLDALAFSYFHHGVDAQLVIAAKHNWNDVRPVAKTMLLPVLGLFLAGFTIEYALVASARATPSPRAHAGAFVIAIVALFAVPLDAMTPEISIARAFAFTPAPDADTTTTTITDVPIPMLTSHELHPPNVLFVLLESIRAESYCQSVDASCDVAPKTRELFAGGVAFKQARSIASYTAVSFDAIVTGRSQEGTKATLQKMPTLFEYLHHARIYDRPIFSAYFSSQSASVFERASARSAIDSSGTVETLVGHEVADEDDVIDLGVDRLLANRVATELPTWRAPYFAFVHVSGTHAPYFVDDTIAPKKPYVRHPSWSNLDQLRNAYDDAIFTQDESVAAMIRTFIDAQHGAPYVIVLTSDHGEAFGEHSAIHHGQNLYDEQIHVPLFVTFGNGALGDEKIRALRANANDAWVTHLDLLPTFLDAFGLAPTKLAIVGNSLFSSIPRDRAPIPITNCTAIFPCPVNAWGMLAGDRAIVALPWDGAFACRDLSKNESIVVDATCESMRVSSRAVFPRLPNGQPNR